MKITIITDNTVYRPGLKSEWGLSCLVEVENTPRILFDTGASGPVFLHNMKKLDIDPKSIDCVFISHDHWDHTGGLRAFLELNKDVRLFFPSSFPDVNNLDVKEAVKVKDSLKIYEDVFSTGTLKDIEQSMVVKTDKGSVVIAGCSHPGVGNILRSAKNFADVAVLIGGLHGFSDFELIKDLELICATHCTQHKDKIRQMYMDRFIEGGAGREILI